MPAPSALQRPSPPGCNDAPWASQTTVPSAYLHPRFQGQEPPGFPGRFTPRQSCRRIPECSSAVPG
ncbi:hypothetical protein FPZ47_22565 [Mycobacterium helveticum]|uniref:Uncharacterized protein n=1 Tax=Mycobacterium helveticum TaxID=2592811 RepID=A0A557XEL0_9MYCO|nr:hypothetical protein FPZ46_23215 [Mycobacterium helveticum]TVS84016.1 hypothetical protein FPZ47_22565 [Mycobacterium helveticum]